MSRVSEAGHEQGHVLLQLPLGGFVLRVQAVHVGYILQGVDVDWGGVGVEVGVGVGLGLGLGLKELKKENKYR